MSNYEKKKVGLRLKKLREVQTGLSQTQFAKFIGYETQNIQALERGKTSLANVTYVRFVNYAYGLDMQPYELFELLYVEGENHFADYITNKEKERNE